MKIRPHLNVCDWQLMWWGRWLGLGVAPDMRVRSFSPPLFSVAWVAGPLSIRRWMP